jgi:peptide deformylase
MKQKALIQIGHPVLRKRAKVIQRTDGAAVRALIKRLVTVMRRADLVGISAPQIGVSKRIFVSEIRKTKARPHEQSAPVKVYINPRIIGASKQRKGMYEGCGSVLEGALFAQVPRHTSITLKYHTEQGIELTESLEGLEAHIVQHEIDHLDGILFLDRVVDMKTCISRELYKAKQRTRHHS